MKLIPEVVPVHRHQEYGRGLPGVEIVRLTRFSDDGGSITELARLDEAARVTPGLAGFRVAQINYSTIEPGVIKAFHVHARQRDVWFVPPHDRLLLVLVDVREDSPTPRHVQKIMLGDGGSTLVSIPPGVAHGCRNVGSATATIIYMTDVHFSPRPETTDEGRLPWDMAGEEVWEPGRE